MIAREFDMIKAALQLTTLPPGCKLPLNHDIVDPVEIPKFQKLLGKLF